MYQGFSQSSFSPLALPSLQCWLDVTDPARNGVVPANGSAVSTWKDKSRILNDFTQGTGANQPIFNTNQYNGKPAIAFNGAKRLQHTVTSTLNGTSMSSIVLCAISGGASFTAAYSSKSSLSGLKGVIIYSNAATTWEYWVGDGSAWVQTTGVPMTLNALTLLIGKANASSNPFVVQNTNYGTSTTTYVPNINKTAYVGAGEDGNARFNGNILEVVSCNAIITDAQQALLYGYMRNKYNF